MLVPKWDLNIVRDRVSSHDTAQTNTWNEVKQRLMSKYRER
ncbi:hypothetical protein MC7420_4862 [Coleofasciculus chthonoplastes PCC 7420]|uniref:Uncharacterized protein n=1 Tax=Coleofasciculus chthonoplastes PCC 7420 TaxID=118168 RepID=B4VNA8_9CYAN|nr:hypothetical protein MC7420_4862 [Coleofasciculus chthonoplastes PCC 7420]